LQWRSKNQSQDTTPESAKQATSRKDKKQATAGERRNSG
jgi:hypothetical protein